MRKQQEIDRANEVLDELTSVHSSVFVRAVEVALRRLNDREIRQLFLTCITPVELGDPVDVWTLVLSPIIEKEFDLRRDLEVVPDIGPTIAPELYQKGGGHYAPF